MSPIVEEDEEVIEKPKPKPKPAPIRQPPPRIDRRMPHPSECGKIVMDIGSGARPYGNIQLDLLPEESDKHHIGSTVLPTVVGDAHHLPFREKIADRMLYLHIIEHLRRPLDALEDGHRVLKNFGSIRIEIPNPRLWEHERDEHLYSWHPDTFHNIVNAAGFIIKRYHQGGKNHSIEAIK